MGERIDHAPTDLTEVVEVLATELGEEAREQIATTDDMIVFHHGLGTGIRNRFGLWQGSLLAQWFNERGVLHPDSMSMVILRALQKRVRGEPFDDLLDTPE